MQQDRWRAIRVRLRYGHPVDPRKREQAAAGGDSGLTGDQLACTQSTTDASHGSPLSRWLNQPSS
jgi:hypothetical protein